MFQKNLIWQCRKRQVRTCWLVSLVRSEGMIAFEVVTSSCENDELKTTSPKNQERPGRLNKIRADTTKPDIWEEIAGGYRAVMIFMTDWWWWPRECTLNHNLWRCYFVERSMSLCWIRHNKNTGHYYATTNLILAAHNFLFGINIASDSWAKNRNEEALQNFFTHH